jgi:hypothetical protein
MSTKKLQKKDLVDELNSICRDIDRLYYTLSAKERGKFNVERDDLCLQYDHDDDDGMKLKLVEIREKIATGNEMLKILDKIITKRPKN